MRPPSAPLRVWLYRRAADMRKSYDGLSALARQALGEDPLSGSVFCFINRRRTQMKCLYFDGDGYCVWSKRLERGRFQVRFDGEQKMSIDAETLQHIIDGIDPRSIRRFKRYRASTADRVVVP